MPHCKAFWLTLCLSSALSFSARAHLSTLHTGSEIQLWPGTAPGGENVELTEQVIERSDDPHVHDRAWTGISHPSITAVVPKHPNGAALIVAPGGGYQRVVFDKEGYDLAPSMLSHGVTLFILKYRLPGDGFAHRQLVPLQDAQRAIRIVRGHAKAWHLSPDRIGIIGFSAGGQLAASLGTRYNVDAYEPVDDLDKLSARPNFLALLYPVISMQDGITHSGTRSQLLGDHPTADQINANSLELQVTDDTPPTFIAFASDDGSVPPANNLRFYQQLLAHDVAAEIHGFEYSGHGFGIRNAQGNARDWPKLLLDWLRDDHFLHPEH